MPTTRKTSGARSAAASGRQSTLTFNNRVTKNVPKSAKDSVISSSVTKKATPEKAKAESIEPVKTEEEVETKVEQVEPEKEEEDEKAVEPEPVTQKTDAEVQAEKVTDAQIKRYWNGLEAQRKAKRVHQEDLSLGEKVLRYFDVSSQYGPCIGMTRMRRWQRAERLGLSPPIEVLAVLMKEEAKGNSGIEKAAIDELMNATLVGA